MLAVVDQQEQRLGSQVIGQAVEQPAPGLLGKTERGGDLVGDQGGVRDGRELDQPDAVDIPIHEVGADLQHEPRLARPAGPDQADQPMRVGQGAGLGQLTLAADERGELRRKIRPKRAQRAQRREVARQVGCDQLKHVLRAVEVTQPMLASISELESRRQQVPAHCLRCTRDQDLVAVPDGQQPRDAIHGRAVVVPAARLGIARMDGHPHPKLARGSPWLSGQGSLAFGGRLHRRVGLREDGQQSVTGRFHDRPVLCRHGTPQDRVVDLQRRAHGVTVGFPQPGTAFDVGHEERDRAGGSCHEIRAWTTVVTSAGGAEAIVARPFRLPQPGMDSSYYRAAPTADCSARALATIPVQKSTATPSYSTPMRKVSPRQCSIVRWPLRLPLERCSRRSSSW